MTAQQPVPRYLHCVYRNHLNNCSHPESNFKSCICTTPTGICTLHLPPVFTSQITPDWLLCTLRDLHNHCHSPLRSRSLFCDKPLACPHSEHPDCPFCNLRRLTPWYLCDTENNIVVCKDLQSKQYSYRILVVGFGKDWHVPYLKLSLSKKALLLELLMAIVRHHLATGPAHKLVTIDYKHSYPAHGHLQACMLTSEDDKKFRKEHPLAQKVSLKDGRYELC